MIIPAHVQYRHPQAQALIDSAVYHVKSNAKKGIEMTAIAHFNISNDRAIGFVSYAPEHHHSMRMFNVKLRRNSFRLGASCNDSVSFSIPD